MDLLIEQKGKKTKLSDLGLFLIDFNDQSPYVEKDRKGIKNRHGCKPSKSYFKSKSMIVSGKFLGRNMFEVEEKKDDINALLVTQLPFYVTKLLPVANLYDFELPGQRNGIDIKKVETRAYKYRYEMSLESEIMYTFIGKTDQGLLYDISFELVTDSIPFGQTIPVNETVSNSIKYLGTADCSQLEYPWWVKLTGSFHKFYLQIGSRRFEYDSKSTLTGELIIKGFETTLNGKNVNQYTNYEHFILPSNNTGTIPIETNFTGTIEVLNKVEFYK